MGYYSILRESGEVRGYNNKRVGRLNVEARAVVRL